jgi:beta-lactamase regulating signal transducer with metallopeptidase domain
MNVVLQTALSNALAAALLALVVWAIARLWKSAALRHALWLLVLVKLVTPPLLPVPISLPWSLPASQPTAEPVSNESAAANSQSNDEANRKPFATADPQQLAVADGPILSDLMPSESPELPLLPEEFEDVELEDFPGTDRSEPLVLSDLPASIPPESEPFALIETEPRSEEFVTPAARESEIPRSETNLSVVFIVFAVWLMGTVAWFVLAGTRILRFQKLLRFTLPAPSLLQSETARLASRLGLKSCPPVEVVNGPISPMLWAFCGRARILLPTALLDRLSPAARETLLLHELAHYRRRDHWVRVLEFVVTGLYWWNPVVWWALREIHLAEEECCDGWVISQSPQNRSIYARALLETIDFLTAARLHMPPIASGIARVQILEQRLRGIMMESTSQSLSIRGRLFLFVLAFGCLPLLPWFTKGAGNAAEPLNSHEEGSETSSVEPPDVKPAAASNRIISFEGRNFSEPTEFETTSVPLQFAEQEIRCLAISKDGKQMIAGHGSWTTPGLVRLWNLETQKPLASWKRPLGISGNAISPDGRVIAAAGWDRMVTFYDTETFEEIRRIGPESNVARIAFSPNGKTLATATESAELKLWDVASGQEKRSVGGNLFRM